MKIEICEGTRWVAIISVVILGIVTTIVACTYFYNVRVESAFKNGYEEGTVPGANGVNWVKVK